MPEPADIDLSDALLTKGGSAPLYQKIYDFFRRDIVSGRIKKGAVLPSEQEVIDALGVSRITARRAFNELAASGYVTRHRGRGTIVTHNAAAPIIRAGFEQLIASLKRMGVESQVRLIHARTIKPNRELRSIMELGPDEKVQKIVRVRSLDGEPFSYLVTHIPLHVAAKFDPNELASEPLIEMLDRAGHQPVAATQTITAVAATDEIAAQLEIPPGMPLLKVRRMMRDESHQIVQEITAHYRGDLYQYHVSLLRQADERWTYGDEKKNDVRKPKMKKPA